MSLTLLSHRQIIRISGADRQSFLQGLVTNDVAKLATDNAQYAALLSPQGKIIADFILLHKDDEIWLECWQHKTALLLQKLQMFKLRAKVVLRHDAALRVYHSLQPIAGGFTDPRHDGLGHRLYSAETMDALEDFTAYTQLRLELGIPESEDVIEERSFPMELGINQLHGVSYTKGCYVGQEVVARSKTRGVLHKAIHKIKSRNGAALPAKDIAVMQGEAEIGVLRTIQGSNGLAILRIEEASGESLTAAGIPLIAELPDWFSLPTPVMQGL